MYHSDRGIIVEVPICCVASVSSVSSPFGPGRPAGPSATNTRAHSGPVAGRSAGPGGVGSREHARACPEAGNPVCRSECLLTLLACVACTYACVACVPACVARTCVRVACVACVYVRVACAGAGVRACASCAGAGGRSAGGRGVRGHPRATPEPPSPLAAPLPPHTQS